MKSYKIIAIIFSALIIFGLTSCESCSSKNQPADTHVHDDGSVHGNHEEEAKAPASQESFQVKADSTVVQPEKKDDHKHDHSDPNHKH